MSIPALSTLPMAPSWKHSSTPSKLSIASQATLSQILDRLPRSITDSNVPAVFEPTFVLGTSPSPQEVSAAFVDQKKAEAYWVVISGREPGLYTTSDEAKQQTFCVPHQHHQRVVGFQAALAFYTAHYPDGTKKWVEVPHSELGNAESLVQPTATAAGQDNDGAALA
ncbi:hypothetical protein B0H19DRAFT_1082710 [Mycena capillaripes]|nr:hypothetical protein B0H19DRAFT_1082710 [Mycena capillaripes]